MFPREGHVAKPDILKGEKFQPNSGPIFVLVSFYVCSFWFSRVLDFGTVG